MVDLNTAYVSTNRGIIKILQIIVGLIVCSMLCANWNCLGVGRVGFASGLNFLVLLINVVLLVLNLLNFAVWSTERLYSMVCLALFLIAAVLLIWFILGHDNERGWLVASTLLIVVEFLLFLWDVKILQGESPN